MGQNQVDAILAEAGVDYNVGTDAANVEAEAREFSASEIATMVDSYYEADQAEKAAKKQKSTLKEQISEALNVDEFDGTRVINGINHNLQIAKQHSYSLNQEKCDLSKEFNEAFDSGLINGVVHECSVTFGAAVLDKVVEALSNAGLAAVAASIKKEWKLDATAAEVRTLAESVSAVNLKDFLDVTEKTNFTAKK